jgi:class 3 adenylate cyclase
MGDAIMAFFNAPILQTDHTLRAVRAALQMRKAINQIKDEFPPELRLQVGIGIHSGDAVLGLVGTEKRMDYTAIGDSVNMAKRLQENAAPGQILISAQTFQAIKDSVLVDQIDPLNVKGKKQLIPVYEISGLIANKSAHNA